MHLRIHVQYVERVRAILMVIFHESSAWMANRKIEIKTNVSLKNRSDVQDHFVIYWWEWKHLWYETKKEHRSYKHWKVLLGSWGIKCWFKHKFDTHENEILKIVNQSRYEWKNIIYSYMHRLVRHWFYLWIENIFEYEKKIIGRLHSQIWLKLYFQMDWRS